MKFHLVSLLLCFFACFSTVKAQENPSKSISSHKSDDPPKEDTIKVNASTTRQYKETDPDFWDEKMPAFPGGDAALMSYWSSNVKYPQKAINKGIQGTCVIQFVINEDGSISDVSVSKDIGGGCGEEGVRVVKAMPKWIPGRQYGKFVKVKYKLPIKFHF